MLTDGIDSLLMNILREKNNLIYNISGDTEIYKWGAVIEINYSTDEVDKCNSLITEIIENIREYSDFIDATKNKYRTVFSDECDTDTYQCEFFSEQYFNNKRTIIYKEKDIPVFVTKKKYIHDTLLGITPDTVYEICQKYFKNPKYFICR